MMEDYLNELKDKEFVVEIQNGKSKTYKLTTKGFDYLSEYKVILNFTESFGLA